MKLIRQVNLSFAKGNSDKVYEVDLCEVGVGQFVVNFRYGRRGSSLRDGTKTPAPVDRANAEKIFDDLVASKTKKGYSESGSAASPSIPATAKSVSEPNASSMSDPVALAILNRIAKGPEPSNWKLSRAVWRAGELRLREAEVLIAQLIGTGDAMLDYCIAWSLSRIGSADCLVPLDGITRNKSYPNHVRRMADEAKRQICSENDRELILNSYIQQLPDWCQNLAKDGPAEAFSKAWFEKLSKRDRKAVQSIDTLYFIDNEHVRPALIETLRTVPLKPSFFRHLRRIFKSAELRGDAEVFGVLSARFAKEKHDFVMPNYWGYLGKKKPTVGDSAQKAYSKQTRNYLRGRVWRSLERLGRDKDPAYCEMATGLLLQFSDEDAQAITSHSTWDYSTYNVVQTYCDQYGRYWAFSNIIARHSSRYRRLSTKLRFDCERSFNPNENTTGPTEREEAYPKLWDSAPRSLLRLMQESRCERVHQFAALALIENKSFCSQIDLNILIDLLSSPYQATCSFAFDAVVSRYDAANPDRQLVLALANCALERARLQSYRWIELQRSFFFDDAEFAAGLIVSPFSDTRLFARDSLRTVDLSSEKRDLIVRLAVAHLLAMPEAEWSEQAANEITSTITQSLGESLRQIGVETIGQLLSHPLEGVQLLGGEAILRHDSLSRQPPAEMLHLMLGSRHTTVRGLAIRIVNQLNDDELRQSIDLLFALTRHPEADVRNEIRPTVVRIAKSDSNFAGVFADRLIDALLTPGAPEGVPSHTSRVLIDDLRENLAHVDGATVWKLLQSRSQPAQDVGGVLLSTNIDSNSLSVEELVKLASHDVLSVRESCWAMCQQGIERLRKSMASTVRLLDSKWDDSREFGFKLFREQIEESDLSSAVLISICDSVREDVQRFGCDLITKRFEERDGQEYLLKLSEHPSPSLQLFATNFLDRYAVDNPERLQELEPYFMSVLTRVNKARVAKDRVLALLSREATKSPEAAHVASRIMSKLSATAAIGDKARTIEMMAKIREQYPDIPLPIEIQTVEVR